MRHISIDRALRRSLLLLLLLAPATLVAEEVTLPAAASIVGGAPFFSDVRVFNTSYSSALEVTARYRCFIPSPCTTVGAATVPFTLAPREARAFNDMVAATFQAPDTAGGVEFEFSGGSDQLVVTSRLYSTSPTPTVGMFIPGVHNSEAHPRTVLTSIRNGTAFRTNVGVFNREDSAVDVTFFVIDAGAQIGSPISRSVPGHSGVQVNNVFNAAGDASHATENATISVMATGEIFSYAAVIDNATTDPIFVRGAEDVEPITGAPVTKTVRVGMGGMNFVDDEAHGSVTHVQVGDTVSWVSDGAMRHGVTSGTCTGGYYGEDTCDPDGAFSSGAHSEAFQFSHQFTAAGTFPYYCPVHGGSMKGRVIVDAPGAAASQSPKRRAP